MTGPVQWEEEQTRPACWAHAWSPQEAYAVIREGAGAARGEAAAQHGTAASSCWTPALSCRMAPAEGRTLAVASVADIRHNLREASETGGCRGGSWIPRTDRRHAVAAGVATGAHCLGQTTASLG